MDSIEENYILSSENARSWWNRQRVNRSLNALKRNGFNAFFFETELEAANYILSIVPKDASIGVGGSVTIREMGILEKLQQNGHTIFNHWLYKESDPRRYQTQLAHLTCDVFLTSTNAITMNGALVNSDGSGNRVASMIFGPPSVIIVAGVNKIVATIDEGVDRIRNRSAPKNNKRKERNLPCSSTGYCVDCKAADCFRRITTIIEKRPRQNTSFTVILVNQELGY